MWGLGVARMAVRRSRPRRAVVADQPAREADQDRRQGHEPRPLRHLPIGRGHGVAADVPGNLDADRPTAVTAGASVTGKWDRIRQAETAEVRLDQGSTAGSSASARLTARFGPPAAHAARDCRCQGSSRARSWPQHPRESGECRFNRDLSYVIGTEAIRRRNSNADLHTEDHP